LHHRSIVGLIAVVTVAATACTGGTTTPTSPSHRLPTSTPATTASPSVAPTPSPSHEPPPEPGSITVNVPDPSELVAAFGSVWAKSGHDLVHVSRQGHVVKRIRDVVGEADFQSQTIAAGFGSVWTLGQHQVMRIDPASDRVVANISLPGIGWMLAAGNDGIWVAGGSGGIHMVRIDPATNTIDLSHRLGTSPAGFTMGAGVMWWINSSSAASISRFDTSSWGETYIGTGFYVADIVVTPSAVWLIDNGGQVARMAPDASRPGMERTKAPLILSATYDDGTVWLYGGNLVGFDAATGHTTARIRVNGFEKPQAVAGVAALGSMVWTADPLRDRLVAVRS
jgi:hypothetical protein